MPEDLESLDRALTAANLQRARARVACAENWTQDAADAAEQAWEEVTRVGELYLAARFEHEAREAGLHIDPSDVEYDIEVDPVQDEIRQVREGLSVYDAVVRAMEDPHGALDVVLGAEDQDAALDALRVRYGFDDTQARVVVENLFRGATMEGRRRNQRHRQELLDRLRDLESRSSTR